MNEGKIEPAYDERKNAMVTDFQYFLENLDRLFSEYGNKYIAIKNKTILGVYDDFVEAITNTAKTESMGSFIVQHCSNNIANHTAVFHSNVLG
jgi:hypothetical protein